MAPEQWLILALVAVALVALGALAASALVRALGDDPDRDPPWLALSPILYVFRKFLYRRK